MTDSDKVAFAGIISGVAENFGKIVGKPGLRMFWACLKGYTIEQVEAAAADIVMTRRYTTMPTVADFVDRLTGKANAEDRAQIEAGKVWNAIGSVGAYRSVVFDDQVTMAVIQYGFGGWVQLCEEASERTWFFREFTRVYAAYCREGQKSGGSLAGRSEIVNTSRGLPYDKPVLVGDPGKAQAVLAWTPEDRRPASVAIPINIKPLPYDMAAKA